MAIPLNTISHTFGTVDQWRARAAGLGCRTWKEAMRRFSFQHGKAIAMLGDDSARIVTRDYSRKSGVSVETLPPEAVKWFQSVPQ